jgi:hypothetical protein
MKQTAVEWLYSKWSEQATLYLEDLDQAKAMEKEQIIEAYDRGYDEYDIYRNGQNYYNETFKSE